MTQSGGPAAINGFLYQILHHLGWLADVHLKGQLDGQEIKDASLVLEPRSGGDARAEAFGTYLVEQYKTREAGTWSLADLESVLCDLRKAVPSSQPGNACFRFVSDGRPGRLDPFTSFLADVKSATHPNDLDNTKRKTFSNNLILTNREFFDHVVKVTRSGTPSPTADGDAVVFYLLQRFQMTFGASGSRRAIEVERLLRHYAPNLGDESKIREHLIGVLVEKLSTGETALNAGEVDEMFRHVGLNPERLRNWAKLAETTAALTRKRLARLKYEADRDIRATPEWPKDKPVLLIAGESGVGKTWQLGRLLEALGEERQLASIVFSAKTRDDLLNQASRDVWQHGLGETSEKSIVALSHFLRELGPDASTCRLIVGLDDVRDVDLARELIRQDWSDWGMRLVLTVPRTVARSLMMTDDDIVHLHSVDEFSIDELDSLLKRSGRQWADLPSDMKKLLRNPILAGLFVELPYLSPQKSPRSEYEIFERFWERIAIKGRRGDEGLVMALAAHVRDGKPYPLAPSMWHGIGLNSEGAIDRLEAAGWLRCTENEEVVFRHDRLLNWAVAKFLVSEFKSKRLPSDDLAVVLAGEPDWYINRLGYVLMDALWLLAKDDANTAALGQIIARMENSHRFGSSGEDLYTYLLPTLGQQGVPALLERLNAITAESEGDYRIGLIGKAFANLARQENVELQETVSSLLNAQSRDRQKVAIAVLTESPDTRYLNRLWELHQRCLEALEDKTDDSRYDDYKNSFAALRAGVAHDPTWLQIRILEADEEKEPISELAFLLNGLEHPDAPAIWSKTADTLFAKVPAGKPRSLLYCIARFSDRERLSFVFKHISRSEHSASDAALLALSLLDPLAAIDRLAEVKESELYLTRNHWLPIVLHVQPELTRQRIRKLADSDPISHRKIVDLFWERPDSIDETTLHFVLRSVERHLREHLDEAIAADPVWLYHPLDFLARIAHPKLLATLQAEVGGELERMIASVACSRLRGNSAWRDHVLESARQVLILIGGEGLTALIMRELESEHFWIRHGGLNCAFLRNDERIIERIAAIARRPVPRGTDGKPEPEPYDDFVRAITALAALGADSVIVELVWQHGLTPMPPEWPELRAYRGLMPKALTDQALRTLQSTVSPEDSLQKALVIAWLSGDADLIAPARSVLERTAPESETARYSSIALRQLGDHSDEFARLAYRMAQTEVNGLEGLNALLSSGQVGLQLIRDWLQSRKIVAPSDSDCETQVIRILYDKPETRELSIEAAVKRCMHSRFLLDAPYEIAAEANEPALREEILDKAFAARSFVTTLPLRAIQGLAKFDVMRAVEAIELGLQSHQKIERELCRLLVSIAPEAAVAKLIDAASSIERGSLRRAAGRALRRLDPDAVARGLIERMTASASERKVAAEVAGWLPIASVSEVLGHLANYDSSIDVRNAALGELDLQRSEANIRELLAAFPAASAARRWSLLVAILETADPYLLTDREDPLWLGSILSDDVPGAFTYYAEAVVAQRKQKKD
jgi:hypothetical protein